MRITKEQLKQIIKEELEIVLQEEDTDSDKATKDGIRQALKSLYAKRASGEDVSSEIDKEEKSAKLWVIDLASIKSESKK